MVLKCVLRQAERARDPDPGRQPQNAFHGLSRRKQELYRVNNDRNPPLRPRCRVNPTLRHPLLTFLAWQAVGLSLLLVHIGTIVLTGAVVLPMAVTATVLMLLYIANPLAGFAVFLQILLYQNVCVSLISPSLTPDLFRSSLGTSFLTMLPLAAVAACRLWSSGRNRRILTYLALAVVVLLGYTALGAARSSPSSAAAYFRSSSAVLMGLLIGWDLSRENDYRTVASCFLVSLALGLGLTFCEITVPVDYYEAINAPRFYDISHANAMSAAPLGIRTGQDVVNMLTDSFFNIGGAGGRSSLRFGGPNMHSVSYAYVMAIGAIVALSLGAGWLALPILPLLFLIGVKGSSILLLGTVLLWIIGKLFGARFLAISGLALGAVYLTAAIKFGLAAGDYHVLGFLGGVHGFMSNPLGHGLGVGGNLSSDVTSSDLTRVWDANQRFGAETPLESAIGVLIYQMGVGSVAVGYMIWTAFTSGFGRFRSRLGFVPIAIAVLTFNSVLQEEAFSPYSMGLLAIFAGALAHERRWVARPAGIAPTASLQATERPNRPDAIGAAQANA